MQVFRKSKSSSVTRKFSRQLFRLITGLAIVAGVATTTSALQVGATTRTPKAQTNINAVPASARMYYKDYQLYAKLYSDSFADWTPPKGKVKYCGDTFYLGNTFQQVYANAFAELVNHEVKVGEARAGFNYLNSNDSTATGIAQLNSQIEEGCNVIFIEPSSTTAFCPTVAKAFQKGILIISNEILDCGGAMSLSYDVYETQYQMTQALVKVMGNKGNVIEVTGIPGNSAENTATSAANAVIAQHPGVKVVGVYTGDWTASVAQTATAQWVATHPTTKVNGIVDEGAMGVAAESALQQAGLPLAKVSFQDNDCQELAFTKEHPNLVGQGADVTPYPAAYLLFNTALRLLAGQKPSLDTIIYPLAGPTKATFSQWYKPGMTVADSCYASPKPAVPALANYIGAFFTGGNTVTKFPVPSASK